MINILTYVYKYNHCIRKLNLEDIKKYYKYNELTKRLNSQRIINNYIITNKIFEGIERINFYEEEDNIYHLKYEDIRDKCNVTISKILHIKKE